MSDRDKILEHLRSRQHAATHPPAWRSRQRYEDLAEQFVVALTAAGGEVVRSANRDAALEQLAGILGELNTRRVAVNDEPPIQGIDWAGHWPDIDWHVAGMTAGDLRAFCAAADAGISGADAALARTGSIVVGSGAGRSRLVTLLPPVHIAIVASSCLTTDLFTWIAARPGEIPASLTLVSGPSKTADIEQVLTTGVHGPKRIIVVLYAD